ncbi:uncharacterized protein LOC126836937 [Adelges cooleyi]|uniref:uncharacterized protein LOC126836937 n=1 Tax=Adelges cooleyi TaxID=133065 RepID=UPI00217FA73B|nr:uncharacterized protein LOC126836937 [Adelges cooleyi]
MRGIAILEKKLQSLRRLVSEEPKLNLRVPNTIENDITIKKRKRTQRLVDKEIKEAKVEDTKDDDYQNKKGKNLMSPDHELVTDNPPQSDSDERLQHGSPEEEKQGGCVIM